MCGTDNPRWSFYSAHTALAFASAFGSCRVSIALPIAAGTGYFRIAAGRHYLTDVLAGAAAGTLTGLVLR